MSTVIKNWLTGAVLAATLLPTLALPTFAQGPLQAGLQDEILGTAQQSAIVGLGQRAASELDIRVYVLRFVRGALSFVGLIFVILILYGGFTFMTGGTEEKMDNAKKIIGHATIGVLIIITSYGIALFFTRRIVRSTFEQMLTQVQSCSTQTGNATCCNEWNAFQSAGSPIDLSEDVGDQAQENRDTQRERYEAWVECRERAASGAQYGDRQLDSNIFD